MAALAALHRALADFGTSPGFVPTLVVPPLAGEAPPPAMTRCEAEALAAEAVAEAEARLRFTHAQALEQALGEMRAAERASHAQALQRVLADEAAAAATAIAAGLEKIRAEVAAEVSAACASMLLPFLGEAMAGRAVAALAGALGEALAEGGAMRVTVSGPPLLREALGRELGAERAARLQWRDAEGPDLSAVLDGQVLETRLGAFADALKGGPA